MQEYCKDLYSVVDYAYCTIPTYPSGQIGFVLCSLNPVSRHFVKSNLYDRKALAKQGGNGIGRVCPSLCVFVDALTTELFDLWIFNSYSPVVVKNPLICTHVSCKLPDQNFSHLKILHFMITACFRIPISVNL